MVCQYNISKSWEKKRPRSNPNLSTVSMCSVSHHVLLIPVQYSNQLTRAKKMVACTFYQDALRSEIVWKSRSRSFDKNRDKTLSYFLTSVKISNHYLLMFFSYMYLIPAMHCGEMYMPLYFLLWSIEASFGSWCNREIWMMFSHPLINYMYFFFSWGNVWWWERWWLWGSQW